MLLIGGAQEDGQLLIRYLSVVLQFSNLGIEVSQAPLGVVDLLGGRLELTVGLVDQLLIGSQVRDELVLASGVVLDRAVQLRLNRSEVLLELVDLFRVVGLQRGSLRSGGG